MLNHQDELYYTACWRELQSFLTEVVLDDTGEYPQAADFLKLMKSVERKVESNAESYYDYGTAGA